MALSGSLTLVTAPLPCMFLPLSFVPVWGDKMYMIRIRLCGVGGGGYWTWTSREKCREIGRKVHKNDFSEDQKVAELGPGVGKKR